MQLYHNISLAFNTYNKKGKSLAYNVQEKTYILTIFKHCFEPNFKHNLNK